MTERAERLEPCPFCGGEPELRPQGNNHTRSRKLTIKCKGCRFQLTNAAIRHGFDWLEKITIDAWNRRAPTEAGVPDGYRLVPVEPTQTMCQAMQEKLREWPRYPFRVAPVYQAALAAAPAAPKPTGQEPEGGAA
ncbi:Lar family restriction alleviation protein [Cupriavidus basilensis]|uniref:Lar family restriction alleviation protein n=1 Tax=Cupriavidus basilensis TaxID=68895 RepID=UPI0009E1EEC6|nr:Lar family restriction alleviation protein [Cupriavidus basilensis]